MSRDSKKTMDTSMTVKEFVDTYYRPGRLKAEKDRRERIIADRERDLREIGEARISKHDSVTGEMVVLVNPRWRPKRYLQWCATY